MQLLEIENLNISNILENNMQKFDKTHSSNINLKKKSPMKSLKKGNLTDQRSH
jgi:hypothetical protein